MNDRPPYLLGAFAIVLDEQGRVLLCHRTDREAWDLPGGSMETDELPDEAVVREACEETGLRIAVEKLTGIYKIEGRDELVFAFLARITGGMLHPGDEVRSAAFFDPEDLPHTLLPFHRSVLRDALAGHAAPLLTRRAASA